VVLVLLALLSGCATTPGADDSRDAYPLLSAPDARADGRIADLLERAERAAPDEAVRLQLEAAVLLALRDDPAAAAGLVDDLDGARLDSAGRGRLALLRAGVALESGKVGRALTLIEQAPGPEGRLADVDRLILFTRIRIRVLEAGDRRLAAARERVLLDGLLEADARVANRQAIWQLLADLSAEDLEHALAGARGSPELAGWIELARIARGLYPTLEAQQADVIAWRQRNPEHPATAAMPERLARLPGLMAERPRHLALLLPLSGPLASAGSAVRDGFMAAHLEALSRGGFTPRITLIDTHAVEIGSAYYQALDQGAEMIIGPLSKSAVDGLATLPEPEIPVLALNTTSEPRATPGVVQFALLPEDEGVQIARRARADGAEHILVLHRRTPWAERVREAVRRTFVELGGEVVDLAGFSATAGVGDAVAEAMLIGESRARLTEMRRILGTDLEFEPRRRRDLDAVVAITDPAGGRTLKPALEYYFAGDLPVYASSHIHDGSEDDSERSTLDGVRFCDMPWRLLDLPTRQAMSAAWPETATEQASFHAMGVDAWRLHTQLKVLEGPGARFSGVTGDLEAGPEGRLHRHLQWALIRNGRPVPLPRVESRQDG
jgi:outer membrane PBP1 activator LpoA protein